MFNIANRKKFTNEGERGALLQKLRFNGDSLAHSDGSHESQIEVNTDARKSLLVERKQKVNDE